MKRPGRLTLKTKLDLWQMLRPAVQPGSTTGYRLPDEEVALTVAASGPIEVTRPTRSLSAGAGCERSIENPDRGDAERARAAAAGDLAGDRGSTALDLTWTTREDDRPRALAAETLLVAVGALWRDVREKSPSGTSPS